MSLHIGHSINNSITNQDMRVAMRLDYDVIYGHYIILQI